MKMKVLAFCTLEHQTCIKNAIMTFLRRINNFDKQSDIEIHSERQQRFYLFLVSISRRSYGMKRQSECHFMTIVLMSLQSTVLVITNIVLCTCKYSQICKSNTHKPSIMNRLQRRVKKRDRCSIRI